jgi:hypothetical protein
MKRRLRLLCLLAGLVACGDNLLRDPSFDLWCGAQLCEPWQATGKVTRTGTWHARDYGVSLADGASLAQLSEHEAVDCIELELLADVEANAAVSVEMDFQDDGVSEYEELIPESHFARLRYLVNTPDWYERVRFILRKRGKGRAVVAQVRATSSEDCDGPELRLREQPTGAYCESSRQCASERCVRAPMPYTELASAEPVQAHAVCSACGEDADCAVGELCDVEAIGDDPARLRAEWACLGPAHKTLGEWCASGRACASGSCSQALSLGHATCGQCEDDADCADAELCGVEVFAAGAARACHAPLPRALGALCVADDECDSGSCCGNVCSECCDDAACEGKVCAVNEAWLTSSAFLCAPSSGRRASGDACTTHADCRSAACELPEPECLLRCDAGGCERATDVDCGFLRQLAGVCR